MLDQWLYARVVHVPGVITVGTGGWGWWWWTVESRGVVNGHLFPFIAFKVAYINILH